MKKIIYHYPQSSFLSIEKDMSLIVDMILKNSNLKKMLHYTTRDCLLKPDLTEDESLELFNRNIKMIPRLYVDNSVLNYLIIGFDNYSKNKSNPEFRDSIIEFDIICHFDQWQMKDFQLRPYRIAAELDSMFSNRHLTGIGTLQFLGAVQQNYTNEYAGLCLMYQAVHGEEDKKFMPNPDNEEQFIENFDAIFNE